jgi:outer membrane lipoprotein carrier protein
MAYRTTVALIDKRCRGAVRLFSVTRFLGIATLSVFVCLANETPEQVARRVQDRYNSARTLSVQFVENYQVQGHARPAESGKLTLRKQGKMRWDYTQPAGKLFVSDGKTVYLYTSADNRVEKIPIRDTEDMRAPLAFLLGNLDFKKEFKDLQVREGTGGTWLEGAAKNDRVPYESVEMLVEGDGSVRQLKVIGRDGSSMAFAFSNESLNPRVDDKLFHFTIPPGAEVVDAVNLRGEGK